MLESLLGSPDRPFPAIPRADRFLAVGPAAQARHDLTRVIERSEGPAVLIGSCGLGKTILCQAVEATFRHRFQTVMMSCARLSSRRALFQNILFGLNRPYRSLDEAEARLAVIDHIQDADRCPQGLLLIVDEAQHLAPRLFDELRVLAGLSRGGQPLVRLVISGTPALEERLARASLEAFDQRIAARIYLSPLNKRETEEYLRRELDRVGLRLESCFDPGAVRAIETLTVGIVRLIHQVADHALVLAVADGMALPIGESMIQAAWSDLQQFPFPTPGAAEGMTRPDLIEFGPLEGMVAYDDRADHYEVGPASVTGMVDRPVDDDAMTGLLDDIDDLVRRETFDDPIISDAFDPFADRETEVTIAAGAKFSPLDADFDVEEPISDRATSTARAMTPLGRSSRPTTTAAATLPLGRAESTVGMPRPTRTGAVTSPAMPHPAPAQPASMTSSPRPMEPTMMDDMTSTDDMAGAAQGGIRAVRPDILRIMPCDDRDMILIEDEAESLQPTSGGSRSGEPRRTNLRQLFADMRKS